jgi:hypothetical protein
MSILSPQIPSQSNSFHLLFYLHINFIHLYFTFIILTYPFQITYSVDILVCFLSPRHVTPRSQSSVWTEMMRRHGTLIWSKIDPSNFIDPLLLIHLILIHLHQSSGSLRLNFWCLLSENWPTPTHFFLVLRSGPHLKAALKAPSLQPTAYLLAQ